jgi:hypothetical protein
MDDTLRLLQRHTREVVGELFRDHRIHRVIHQSHRHFGDAGRPFLDFGVVELIAVVPDHLPARTTSMCSKNIIQGARLFLRCGAFPRMNRSDSDRGRP